MIHSLNEIKKRVIYDKTGELEYDKEIWKEAVKQTLDEVINFMEEELHFVDVVECEKDLKKRLNI